MLIYIAIATVAAIVGAVQAGNKGRNAVGWFVLCFLFPLAVFIILALSPLVDVAAIRRELTICPLCKETIKVGALKCKYCGSDFEEPAEPIPAPKPAEPQFKPILPGISTPSSRPVPGKGAWTALD